ncbi:zinc finger protein 521-like [Malaya genurostris]|uniref:zinc finger protein 521-like n=1 Tax=Malaya genurostris TaxID=325434 RepID=UPI0026F3925A|nr:zinc finger protein 521-like [Malaya genurostris]
MELAVRGRKGTEIQLQEPIEPPSKLPSGNSLSYCRLCFSEVVFKRLTLPAMIDTWIDIIDSNIGVRLIAKDDAPFALCYGCCVSIQSVRQFRERCRVYDKALKESRRPKAVSITVTPILQPAGNTILGGVKTPFSSTQQNVLIMPTPATASQPTGSNLIQPSTPSNEVQNLTCQACNAVIPTQLEFQHHLRTNHPKIGGYIKCTKCNKKFRHYENLMRHMEKHTIQSDAFVCGSLPKKKRKRYVRRNPCSLCTQRFTTIALRNEHEVKVHKLMFECNICYARFATQDALDEHSRRRHLAGQPHMTEHMKKYSKVSKTFVCGTCEETFLDRQQYIKHQQDQHNVQPRANDEHQCLACQTVFLSEQTFLIHLDINHTGVEIFTVEDNDSNDDEDVETISDDNSQREASLHSTSVSSGTALDTVATNEISSSEMATVTDHVYQYYSQADGDNPNEDAGCSVDLEDDLLLDEIPPQSGFDLYGSAFRAA